ncbi:MAG TPA: ATP synthase F1 subunit gamma [Thermodesulfobacteriota bacterium]|nr:ATP synthase F1 subunit gamma [Thermodesulfobacteriota bacterium]
MLGTKEIKRRIRSVISIQQITRAMQMIAVSRLKKAEDRLRSARPFAEKIQEFMETLAPSLTSIRHPLLIKREVRSIGLVLITSDKGLCGGYNANVLNQARHFIEKHSDKTVRLILIGRKGYDSYRRKSFPIDYTLLQISKEITLQEVREITGVIIKGFEEARYDEVDLLYTRYYSIVNTKPMTLKLLPLERSEVLKTGGAMMGEPLFEPEPEEIMAQLLPRYLEAQIYSGLVESVAAEQGARMVSMKSATENAEEMISSLTLSYNKARQASITKELLEVTSGAEALRFAQKK